MKLYHVKRIHHWFEHITVTAKDEDDAIDQLRQAIDSDLACRFYYDDDGELETVIVNNAKK